MITLMRTPDVLAATGMARPTLYEHMAKGLFPRPVKLGYKLAAWPSEEIRKLNAARIQGKTPDEIKALVSEMIEARKTCV